MSKRLRAVAIVVASLVVVALGAALALSPGLRTALRLTPGFSPLPDDPRVRVEAGAEHLASQLAAALPDAIARVERAHGLPFTKPFRVYVPATHESFVRRIGQSPRSRVRGFALARDVWVSPLAFDFEGLDTHRETLAHELSHLHFYQHLGKRRQLANVPTWFSEGLADWVSGTGSEIVQREQAVAAILSGRSITPHARGRLPNPRTAADHGMTYPMLHQQSLLFVRFLVERDETAFRAFVVDLLRGEELGPAFRARLGEDLDDAWSAFVGSLEKAAR